MGLRIDDGVLLRHPRLRRLLGIPDPPFVLPRRLESVTRPGFVLAPYTPDDERDWAEARGDSRDWLAPWDSTDPLGTPPVSFARWVRGMDRDALLGQSATFTMRQDGVFVGEISLGAISYGALRSGVAGYWVARREAGHGYAPLALAVAADWAFFCPTGPRLNRLEIDLLPSNAASRRVVEKNHCAYRGVRPAWMHVAGRWRDHEVWDMMAADALGVPEATYRPGGTGPRTAAGMHPCETRLLWT